MSLPSYLCQTKRRRLVDDIAQKSDKKLLPKTQLLEAWKTLNWRRTTERP